MHIGNINVWSIHTYPAKHMIRDHETRKLNNAHIQNLYYIICQWELIL